MAVDVTGATVIAGDKVLLSGIVRSIEPVSGGGDLLLMTLGDGKHAIRVRSEDALKVAAFIAQPSDLPTGAMLYWDGSAWLAVDPPPASSGYAMEWVSSKPTWVATTPP